VKIDEFMNIEILLASYIVQYKRNVMLFKKDVLTLRVFRTVRNTRFTLSDKVNRVIKIYATCITNLKKNWNVTLD
jgi:hypothetical protein